MSHLYRFLVIAGCVAISTLVVHFSKAPSVMPYRGYRVACMPAETAHDEYADKNLIPYAQIAHNSYLPENPRTAYRCYFRFAPQDVVCTPPSVMTRKNLTVCAQFPMIDGNSKKQCYVLNNKLIPLTDKLKKQPPVNLTSYLNHQEHIVKSWQEIRDILLKSSANE